MSTQVTDAEKIRRYLQIKSRPKPLPIKTFAVHGVDQERALRGVSDEEIWQEVEQWALTEERRRVALAETQDKRRADYVASQRCPCCHESGVDSHDYPRMRDIGLGRQIRLCLRCATIAATITARQDVTRSGKVASFLASLEGEHNGGTR